MAKAGYCSECSANVWVNSDGSCANGHPASSVSAEYDTAGSTASPPASSSSSSLLRAATTKNTGKIIAISCAVAALLGCIVLVIMGAVGALAFKDGSAGAERQQCFSQQRLVEGAVAQRRAENEGLASPGDWTVAIEIAGDYLPPGEIECPAGGEYDWTDEGLADCSVHGPHD